MHTRLAWPCLVLTPSVISLGCISVRTAPGEEVSSINVGIPEGPKVSNNLEYKLLPRASRPKTHTLARRGSTRPGRQTKFELVKHLRGSKTLPRARFANRYVS
ncbi:uncharacterized protein LAJ45_03517 [Morchella importuna]|uniref:uncharacterized protein n=1 Tax=Morchella importuna TaxID=1174673 RepID=UPI001E8D4137|nr:uncharacterized protein LAJ45_03517 [Morchella importuna]KAH8152676.1 hypothetical protein LAJ45_03517 [Morchella importuna]